jgi:lipopolysaccharide export system protein LptC
MVSHDNFHSTLVSWLKIILPLVALAILSTLFLVARTVDPSDAIPFAEVDVEDRVREPRLTLPTWAGVMDDGAALTVSADEARPNADQASAERLVARLDMPDGASADLVSATGSLDPATRRLTVSGGVTLSTSSGYRIETERMVAALDRTSLVADQAVVATGPVGRVDADSMALTEKPDAPGQYVLVFKGAVKLLYLPPD